MFYTSRDVVERLKRDYPKGSRIKCIHMNDRYSVPSGEEGTVHVVDDMGTIHVHWDNGQSLGLVYGEDSYCKV